MEIQVPPNPWIGEIITIVFQSKYDDFVPFYSFAALDDMGPSLPDGRTFPVSLDPMVILNQSILDANGSSILDLQIPADQSLIGLTVYFAFITYTPSPFRFLSLSTATPMEIH
jgi:hypothetical protein